MNHQQQNSAHTNFFYCKLYEDQVKHRDAMMKKKIK